MNDAGYLGPLMRLAYRGALRARYLAPKPGSKVIGAGRPGAAIESIYVINLDRHTKRWDRMCGELSRLNDNTGRPVSALATRFTAIDGRYHTEPSDPGEVRQS